MLTSFPFPAMEEAIFSIGLFPGRVVIICQRDPAGVGGAGLGRQIGAVTFGVEVRQAQVAGAGGGG